MDDGAGQDPARRWIWSLCSGPMAIFDLESDEHCGGALQDVELWARRWLMPTSPAAPLARLDGQPARRGGWWPRRLMDGGPGCTLCDRRCPGGARRRCACAGSRSRTASDLGAVLAAAKAASTRVGRREPVHDGRWPGGIGVSSLDGVAAMSQYGSAGRGSMVCLRGRRAPSRSGPAIWSSSSTQRRSLIGVLNRRSRWRWLSSLKPQASRRARGILLRGEAAPTLNGGIEVEGALLAWLGDGGRLVASSAQFPTTPRRGPVCPPPGSSLTWWAPVWGQHAEGCLRRRRCVSSQRRGVGRSCALPAAEPAPKTRRCPPDRRSAVLLYRRVKRMGPLAIGPPRCRGGGGGLLSVLGGTVSLRESSDRLTLWCSSRAASSSFPMLSTAAMVAAPISVRLLLRGPSGAPATGALDDVMRAIGIPWRGNWTFICATSSLTASVLLRLGESRPRPGR